MPRTKNESATSQAAETSAATLAPAAQKKKPGRLKGSKTGPAAKSRKGKGRKRYAPATKAKILAAAKGKTLGAAHAAAQKVGYKGSAASLYQMLRNAGIKRRKKRGRPMGSKNGITLRRGPGRPPKAVGQLRGGLGQVESIVAREVRNRINEAARAAIRELEKLIY